MFYAFIWKPVKFKYTTISEGGKTFHKATVRINKNGLYAFK